MKIEKYEFPEGLYYQRDHLWVKVEEGNKIRVGVTDMFQEEAGTILAVKTRKEGSTVQKGKIVASVQSGKWVGNLKSPVNGKVLKVNEEVKRNPRLINEDPYGKGWIMIIEAESLEDLKDLLKEESEIREWVEEEIKKVRKQ